jgi:hypothetical protein
MDTTFVEPLTPYIQAVVQVRSQDLEKTKSGAMRIREGVAPDRRISVEDAQMRHGRKSKTKRFDVSLRAPRKTPAPTSPPRPPYRHASARPPTSYRPPVNPRRRRRERRKHALYLEALAAAYDCLLDHNQRPEVEHLARARGYKVFTSYEEEASAAKKRPEYERMMKDAKRGAFQVLVIWALDRFGRSMTGNLADVLELDRIGVQVVSVRESWLDTGSPVRTLLIAIFSWVMVRQGKGKKDRMVPIGENAVAWIRKYLDEARPQLVMPPTAGRSF